MLNPGFNHSRALIRMPNWLGDSLMALPVIGSLKAKYPGMVIDLVMRENISGLADLLPEVNRVFSLPGNNTAGRRAELLKARRAKYDFMVVLPNSFRSAWGLWPSNTPVRIGYAGSLRSFTLTHPQKRPPKHSMRQADYFINMVKPLFPGLVRHNANIAIPQQADMESRRLLEACEKPFIGIGFGASYGSAKMWPVERFASLIDKLSARAQIILIGASAEKETENRILAITNSIPVSLVGKTDLPVLAAVLKKLDLYITNDTGPMHLASALGVPVIGLFGPTSPEETKPAGDNSIIIHHGADCGPCWLRQCPKDHQCMTAITVEEVENAALKTVWSR